MKAVSNRGNSSDSDSESGSSGSESEQSDTDERSSETDSCDLPEGTGAVLKHLSNIAGGSLTGSYVPSSLPLGSFVEKKYKRKIWAHKYIDFTKLLDVDERPKKNSFQLEVVQGRIQKSKRLNEITSFKQWDNSFMVFLSVHASNPRATNLRTD